MPDENETRHILKSWRATWCGINYVGRRNWLLKEQLMTIVAVETIAPEAV